MKSNWIVGDDYASRFKTPCIQRTILELRSGILLRDRNFVQWFVPAGVFYSGLVAATNNWWLVTKNNRKGINIVWC